MHNYWASAIIRWSAGGMHNLVFILKMFNGANVLVEASALLDFVEAFGVFSPIIENGIPVLQEFPRAAWMRTMAYRQVHKQIVLETQFKRFVRNGYIVPAFRWIEIVEIKFAQKFIGQQWAAKTAMFMILNHRFSPSGRITVRIIDFAFFVNCHSCSNATFGHSTGSFTQWLNGVLVDLNITFYNKQVGPIGKRFFLGHLQNKQIVGWRVIGDITQVDQFKLFRCW